MQKKTIFGHGDAAPMNRQEPITLTEKINSLKPLLAADGPQEDYFEQPTLLREVPSFNSTTSSPAGGVIDHAELGRRSS